MDNLLLSLEWPLKSFRKSFEKLLKKYSESGRVLQGDIWNILCNRLHFVS